MIITHLNVHLFNMQFYKIKKTWKQFFNKMVEIFMSITVKDKTHFIFLPYLKDNKLLIFVLNEILTLIMLISLETHLFIMHVERDLFKWFLQ